jgi:hypothetical protein
LGLTALSELAFVRKIRDIEMVSLFRKTGNPEKVTGNFLWLIRERKSCAATFMRQPTWALSRVKMSTPAIAVPPLRGFKSNARSSGVDLHSGSSCRLFENEHPPDGAPRKTNSAPT